MKIKKTLYAELVFDSMILEKLIELGFVNDIVLDIAEREVHKDVTESTYH